MDKIIKIVVLEDLPDRNDMLFKLLVPTVSLVSNNFEKEKFRSSIPPVRNNDYFEVTIPKYSLDEFRAHFRMSRTCFEKLLCVVTNSAQPSCKHVFPAKKLLLTIWILSKQESFLSESDRFGMAPSTGHYIFMETIEAIRKLKRDYIKFPNSEEQKEISDIFESKCRIPGIVGAIDGCHIPVKQPQHNPIDFYNRKGFHSIVLQGVCDHKMRFIDVFVGMPGRVHDAKVFKCSPLYKILESEESPIKPECHLMGDSAYGASSFMITPFKDNGHLTKQKSIYNTKLCSVRSVIERAYAQLKGKFRRLKYMDVNNPNIAVKSVIAACIMHNFILLEDGNIGEDLSDTRISDNEADDEADDATERNVPNNKKNFFASLF